MKKAIQYSKTKWFLTFVIYECMGIKYFMQPLKECFDQEAVAAAVM